MTALAPQLTFAPLAESALLVRLGDGETLEPDIVDAVIELAAQIDAANIEGVADVVPSNATILIEFDPAAVDGAGVEAAVLELGRQARSSVNKEQRLVIIPVLYGGDFGPDLEHVAAHVGLTPDQVHALHAGAEYRVACMGFSPGWAYLMGLSPELRIPRREQPRTRVPAGSVAIGGEQTGVYPLESPGGWHVIGRTPLRMFNPERSDPFLLHPGDRVLFAPIDAERFADLERGAADG
jgi:inhibitor of KinA